MRPCAEHGKRLCRKCWKQALGITLGFPVEHLLWERVPVFRAVTHFLGL